MTDMKMTDHQNAKHEIAGHKNAGHEIARHDKYLFIVVLPVPVILAYCGKFGVIFTVNSSIVDKN